MHLHRILSTVTGMAVLFSTLAGCGPEDKTAYLEPSREDRHGIIVLRLLGTPYEMGRQQANLMGEELDSMVQFFRNEPVAAALISYARNSGLAEDAVAQAYPDVTEECRGMADGVEGLSLEDCLILAYADVVVDRGRELVEFGCTQFMARGPATTDGRLLHGRSLDWLPLQHIIDHPALVVRTPEEGIPWVGVGYAGQVAPFTGWNADGLVVAMNDDTATDTQDAPLGRSRAQVLREALHRFTSVEEAASWMEGEAHGSAENLILSSPDPRQGLVVEMSATVQARREFAENGLLYHTNHFLAPETSAVQAPREEGHDTLTRYQRLQQLLEPGGEESLYGDLDLDAMVSVLRDTHNPYTGETHPPELFSGGGSIANNYCLQQFVFDLKNKQVYLSAGSTPVPPKTFHGFHTDELLGRDPDARPEPAEIQ